MKINNSLIKKLKEADADVESCIIILLALHHDLDIEKIYSESPTMQKSIKILLSHHIIDVDWRSDEVIFNVRLFENEKDLSNKFDSWDWVENEYMLLFINVRKDGGGTVTSCANRMKKFFSENPDVRKEDVLEAVKLYLQTVNNPQYLQRADYFIKKGVGSAATSRLEEFVKIIKEKENDKNDIHKMI